MFGVEARRSQGLPQCLMARLLRFGARASCQDSSSVVPGHSLVSKGPNHCKKCSEAGTGAALSQQASSVLS